VAHRVSGWLHLLQPSTSTMTASTSGPAISRALSSLNTTHHNHVSSHACVKSVSLIEWDETNTCRPLVLQLVLLTIFSVIWISENLISHKSMNSLRCTRMYSLQ
jgi:hypothetical protein